MKGELRLAKGGGYWGWANGGGEIFVGRKKGGPTVERDNKTFLPFNALEGQLETKI